jgi:cation transporter-like permease
VFEMRRQSLLILLPLFVAFGLVGWALFHFSGGIGMSGHGWFALIFGGGLTVALSVGLFFLSFYSARNGYDETADPESTRTGKDQPSED